MSRAVGIRAIWCAVTAHAKTRAAAFLSVGTLASAASLTACVTNDPQVVDVAVDDRADVLSWDEFRATRVVAGAPGNYIVEGDIPIHSFAALEKYYEDHYTRRAEKLAVRTFNSADEIWANGSQRQLEYCVSTTFPDTGFWSRNNVIAAMDTAARRWKQVANIAFVYVPSADSDCLSGSSHPHERFFKVAPKALTGAYACSFWPISRDTCSELDGYTVGVDTNLEPPFSAERTLTHELGHVLGLIHEYQRDDASCPAGSSRNLTEYDATSIMQASSGICGGSPTDSLSFLDGFGIRALYGAPPVWSVILY